MKYNYYLNIALTTFLVLFFCVLVTAENGHFPYAQNTHVYELPPAFTNQFSGITDEISRSSILREFYELPLSRTGIVERTQSGPIVTLVLPMDSHFYPEIKNQPLHHVTIRFEEPLGTFLPSQSASSSLETLLASRCREIISQTYNQIPNAPRCYWMAPLQDYGGLAKMSFYALPNGSDESSSVGTNGWGIAFWVDLDNPAPLGWESIEPPEVFDE